MDYHHHARLTIFSREELAKSVVEGRLSLREAAAERGLSRQSASKWVKRYREGGRAALQDRSSRPHRSPRSVDTGLVEREERLRRERWTGVRIAQATGLSRATVSRILTRLKLNKAKMLEPKIPIVRYEHAAPGDLLHIDIKKLARIVKPGYGITGESRRKGDRLDAQALARLARIDPQLLSPIQHRSVQAQADLSVIRARYA